MLRQSIAEMWACNPNAAATTQWAKRSATVRAAATVAANQPRSSWRDGQGRSRRDGGDVAADEPGAKPLWAQPLQIGDRQQWLARLLRASQQTAIALKQVESTEPTGVGPCIHHGDQLIRAVVEQQ
jgi:hypothetical protein